MNFDDVNEKDRPLFAISVTARVVGVHQQTLRNYERWGFVKPYRTSGGTRSYSAHDLQKIKRVRNWMASLGINRAGVEVMLKLMNRIDELEKTVAKLERDLQKEKRKGL